MPLLQETIVKIFTAIFQLFKAGIGRLQKSIDVLYSGLEVMISFTL